MGELPDAKGVFWLRFKVYWGAKRACGLVYNSRFLSQMRRLKTAVPSTTNKISFHKPGAKMATKPKARAMA
jgi:hypothetical protein